MEAFLNWSKGLSKQSRLYPAEEIVTQKLVKFEEWIPEKMSDTFKFETLEASLFRLFAVNSGNLSLQCSIRIANCLIAVYKTDSTPKLWNLFTEVAKKPTNTGMFVIGHVINQIGEHSKSMIQGLVKILVNSGDLFPALFALNACFKKAPNDLKPYSDKIFVMCRKAIFGKEEVVQLISLKLLEMIFEMDFVPQKKIEQTLSEIMNTNGYGVFVMDEICAMIAKWAFKPLASVQSKKERQDDWQIGGKDRSADSKLFDQAFDIITNYRNHFPCIFQHFLNLMKPQFVFDNLSILFKFVRKTSPADIYMLLSLFGRDVRSELFKEIVSEHPSILQQHVLRALAYDEATTREIAALSHQLTSCNSASARLSGASFFSQLAEKYLDVADSYLQMAALYLAVPPEDNPTLEVDMHGMALIASHIIGATRKRKVLIEKVAGNLKMFLARAVTAENIFCAEYTSVFMLLMVLPSEFVDAPAVEKALEKYISFIEGLSTRPDVQHAQAKELTRYVLSFLATHPHISCCERILNLLAAIPCIQSLTAVLCGLFAATEIGKVASIYNSLFLPKLLTAQPSSQYLVTKIKAPMQQPHDLLNPTKFSMPTMDLIYFKVSQQYFAFRALEFYPNVILSLDMNDVSAILSKTLTSNTNLMMVHALALSLLRNTATQIYMPSNIHMLFLPTIDGNQTDIVRMQVTCECIAIWCSLSNEAMSETLRYMRNKKGIGKALLYNAFFSHMSLSNDLAFQILLELNEMVKSPATCAYALFALSTMFKCYPMQITELFVSDTEMSVLLSAMHNRALLSPYNFYNMSLMFQRLLPIVTPEMDHQATQTAISLAVAAFRQTDIPSAQLIMFHTYQTVFAFAKQFVNTRMLVFPVQLGTPLSLQVAACGAFADMLKVCQPTDVDYFNLIPTLLILLQQRNDDRVVDFITAIALQSAAQENLKPERVTAWVRIIKSVLSNGSLPNLQIESSMQVKSVCATISKIILPPIAKIEPFLNECLDDLMTSATRAIENSITEASYSFFCLVLELFNSYKTDTGLPLLELYDSQFAIGLRYGFEDLTHTGEFLFKYLRFHEHNLREHPENFMTVINSYVNGLQICEARNDAFYAVASLICDIARTNAFVYEKMRPCLEKLEPDFAEVFHEAAATFYRDPLDSVQVSVFRATKETYYRYLLVSYVWLHSLFSKSSNVTQILDFLNKEMMNGNEKWRVVAAIDALAASFRYFSEDAISQEVLSKTVEVVVEVNKTNPDLLKDTLSQFLWMISKRKIEHGEVWNSLFDLCIGSCFDCRTIAQLVGIDAPRESAIRVAEKVFEVGNCDETSMLLLTVIMKNAWRTELKHLYTTTRFDNKFRLRLMTRILKQADDIAGEEAKIAEFYFALFKRGGMNDLAQILIANPTNGLRILSVDSCERVCAFCEGDVQNSAAFLQFVHLAVTQCAFDVTASTRIMLAAMKCAVTMGSDPQKGREILDAAFKLIRTVNALVPGVMRKAFGMLTQREQQLIIGYIEKHVAKTQIRHNALNLKSFSSRVPQRRAADSSDDDDWEEL